MSHQSLCRSRSQTLIDRCDLLLPYVGIGLLACGAESTGSWMAQLAALPILAALQNHIQVLQHEGAHFHLHPNRRVNDFITEFFCSLPFFSTLASYRQFHFQHHKHLGDATRDPEIAFYAQQGYFYEKMSRLQRFKIGALDLSGFHFLQFLWSFVRSVGLAPRDSLRLLGFWVVVGGLAAYAGLGLELLKYWFIPQMTVGFFLLKQQGYAEHNGTGSTVAERTNNQKINRLQRFFVFPYATNLHLNHHLHPQLPWRRL